MKGILISTNGLTKRFRWSKKQKDKTKNKKKKKTKKF
jgi:hypothetical protein